MRLFDDTPLRNCQICGKEARIIYSIAGYYVICTNINKKHIVEVGPYKTKSIAVKYWNGEKQYK